MTPAIRRCLLIHPEHRDGPVQHKVQLLFGLQGLRSFGVDGFQDPQKTETKLEIDPFDLEARRDTFFPDWVPLVVGSFLKAVIIPIGLKVGYLGDHKSAEAGHETAFQDCAGGPTFCQDVETLYTSHIVFGSEGALRKKVEGIRAKVGIGRDQGDLFKNVLGFVELFGGVKLSSIVISDGQFFAGHPMVPGNRGFRWGDRVGNLRLRGGNRGLDRGRDVRRFLLFFGFRGRRGEKKAAGQKDGNERQKMLFHDCYLKVNSRGGQFDSGLFGPKTGFAVKER